MFFIQDNSDLYMQYKNEALKEKANKKQDYAALFTLSIILYLKMRNVTV